MVLKTVMVEQEWWNSDGGTVIYGTVMVDQ